jgi:hypothetical protein
MMIERGICMMMDQDDTAPGVDRVYVMTVVKYARVHVIDQHYVPSNNLYSMSNFCS